MIQTITPTDLMKKPQKEELVSQWVGRSLAEVRTPAMVIDQAIFADNCGRMHQKAKDYGAGFRAHLKTHKTSEGSRLQLVSNSDKTTRVVVSTLMEAWEVVNSGLVKDGIVDDILYGLPVVLNKVADLSNLWDAMDGKGVVRLLIDHPEQVKFLQEFQAKSDPERIWNVFVKIDGGQKRAGVVPGSKMFEEVVLAISQAPNVNLHGFYGHAGNAYASSSSSEASQFLSGEVNAVNSAAEFALALLKKYSLKAPQVPFVLSIGSTPTAHAASTDTHKKLTQLLHGSLELHAGNYPLLDLQQIHTGMVEMGQVAQCVRATVVSLYPGRGENGGDEALIDAGAIAFSKDSGPSGIYGAVKGKNWELTRISQEHGTLTRAPGKPHDELKIGDLLEIVGQHACLITAAYPYYFIVDTAKGGDPNKIVDVWVAWKGW